MFFNESAQQFAFPTVISVCSYNKLNVTIAMSSYCMYHLAYFEETAHFQLLESEFRINYFITLWKDWIINFVLDIFKIFWILNVYI